MRTGISLNTATADAALLVDAARAAEAAGFDAIWCYDHLSGSLLGGAGSLDALAILGAVALATDTAAIGPLVLNATTRHAAHIAVAAATLQSLSGGRLRLGLGAGASSPSRFAAELEMFHLEQFSAAQRRGQVVETIAFLRALWAGEPSFRGRRAAFSDVEGVAIPSPVCPIVVGANGPRLAKLAGEHADGVNLHAWEADLDGLLAVARQAAADRGALEGFTLSVEGPFEPAWLDPSSARRAHLADQGVTEVMVTWHPSQGLAPITAAATLLSR